MHLPTDLDDILDAALDELDDDICNNDIIASSSSNTSHAATNLLQETAQGQNLSSKEDPIRFPKPVVFGPPRPSPSESKKIYKEEEGGGGGGGGAPGGNEYKQRQNISNHESVEEVEKAVKDMMRQMENLFPGEDFGKEGNTHVNITPEKVREKETSTTRMMMQNNTSQDSNVMNDAFSKLLRGLSNDENLEDDMFQKFGDQMTEEMQREWEETINKGSGEGEDMMGHVVDGMMKQLLSKEFMYEPMKDITDKFPQWLADNKAKLAVEDYEKYGRQYQYFQRIIDLYDNDPDNTERLTELMTALQEYGQPPADIIQELAPDLELDDEGMPRIPHGFHDGMPDMSNMNEECIMM